MASALYRFKVISACWEVVEYGGCGAGHSSICICWGDPADTVK